jgi:hypothetical protein
MVEFPMRGRLPLFEVFFYMGLESVLGRRGRGGGGSGDNAISSSLFLGDSSSFCPELWGVGGGVVLHGRFARVPPETSCVGEEIDRVIILRSSEWGILEFVGNRGVDAVSRIMLTGVVFWASTLEAAHGFDCHVLSTIVKLSIRMRENKSFSGRCLVVSAVEVSPIGFGVDLVLCNPSGQVNSPERDSMFHQIDGSVDIFSPFWGEGVPVSFIEESISFPFNCEDLIIVQSSVNIDSTCCGADGSDHVRVGGLVPEGSGWE